ncbi:TPL-binding domain in jasmonate signaling [Fragilaria crotonensis]|nr:TPL-binding domain in jasmonate signaling [Fragilaria crotonensis]
MLACRVQRGHLNQDFNWDDIMTGVGGIEGLLYTLRYGNPPPPSSSEAQPQAVHVSEEPPSDLASKSEASLQHDAAKAEEDAAKDTQALRLLASASRALLLAETLLASTKKAAELPPRLSDEFIRNSFPIDPADGHYNYCSICGLSGDVICCEKCPVVMHAPCAGSDRVPEGDWFCSKCNASDTKESKLDEKTEVPGQMKAVMIPLDDARARSGELCKKEPSFLSKRQHARRRGCRDRFWRKTGISGEARKGKGPEDTASDALNQTLDNDDKKN